MTEPARALPRAYLRALPTRPPGTATLNLVPPLTRVRPAAGARRPIHVAVAVGMTAGLYAVSLAGVTALQAATDARLAADRAPAAGAVAQLRNTHDTMEANLTRLAGAYATAATGYQAIAEGIAGHEQALAALQRQVKAAAGSVAGLSIPTISSLPAASGGGTGGPHQVAAPPAPAVQAQSVVVGSPAPLPAVSSSAAVVSSRPVVNACTTASGKPC
jgi:hypothetical protein